MSLRLCPIPLRLPQTGKHLLHLVLQPCQHIESEAERTTGFPSTYSGNA
jgi:hypothetical protein